VRSRSLTGDARRPPQTVVDGDTIKLNGTTYRIWGIDAAETKAVGYGPSQCNEVCANKRRHIVTEFKSSRRMLALPQRLAASLRRPSASPVRNHPERPPCCQRSFLRRLDLAPGR
jgi:hypothetical protein